MIHSSCTNPWPSIGEAAGFPDVAIVPDPGTSSQVGDRQLRLVDRVSHDFRTPLTVIQEYVSLMRDGLAGQISDEQRRMLHLVGNRADDLALLVDDMLDVGRLETGQLRAWRRPTPVADVVAAAEPSLQRKATASGIFLTIQVDADLPDVFCDAEMIGRVMVNLAVEAMAACGPGGSIRVRIQQARKANDVCISVTDDGPGVVPSGSVGGGQATGQTVAEDCGLRQSVARGLVELNLGHVDIHREPGRGSTASFTLPLWDPRALARRALKRLGRRGREAGRVALMAVSAESPFDQGRSNVVDEALPHVFQATDLVLRVQPHRWLAVVGCFSGQFGALVDRVLAAWGETRRSAPEGVMPKLHFAVCGSWGLSEAHEAMLEALDAELAAVEQGGRRGRVLVVDDDRGLLPRLAVGLAECGYDVLTACDGRAAVESASLFRPDVVLMDDLMPGMDGLEAIEQLRQRPVTADIPVVLRADQSDNHQKALELGARACLPRLSDLADVVQALTRAISS